MHVLVLFGICADSPPWMDVITHSLKKKKKEENQNDMAWVDELYEELFLENLSTAS